MSKHTPGPWIFYCDAPTTDPTWHIVTTADRMRLIANVQIESPMELANALLITAAPELLEAALHALNVAESWIHDQLDGTSDLDGALRELEPVREAIAKATGEQA